MSQQITLTVDNEIKAVGDAMKGLVADVKAGKSILTDFQDVFGVMMGALADLGNAAVDVKKVDNQAYLLKCLGDALEVAPVVAPQA